MLRTRTYVSKTVLREPLLDGMIFVLNSDAVRVE